MTRTMTTADGTPITIESWPGTFVDELVAVLRVGQSGTRLSYSDAHQLAALLTEAARDKRAR